jgi:hypothetical protein
LNGSKIELIHINKEFLGLRDKMKQSSILYSLSNKNLLNYYSHPFEDCECTIALNKIYPSNDEIIGINCFDELLFRSELITYASTHFSQDIKENRVLFFSKRLNLYVYSDKRDIYVKYLHSNNKIFIEKEYFTKIKSLKLKDSEVLRIFA